MSEGMKRIADHGNTIELGWFALKEMTLQGAPESQVREMRKAFFAGAQHLFASIISVLDEDSEPTEDDMRRIEMIHVELEAWVDSMKREARGMKDPI